MCGIVAHIDYKCLDKEYKRSFIDKACLCMESRGPDFQDIWQDEIATLGHRRLQILDLNLRSNQPMFSSCKRYVIIFNGEIYNFKDLRLECEKYGDSFCTNSDTEVLLALFVRYGRRMLTKLRGMFAFFVWDRENNSGFMARDPYGIKPLYYSENKDGFFVASQVKAIMATDVISYRVNPEARDGFLVTGSVPEPLTWYSEVLSLPAGGCAQISADKGMEDVQIWYDIRKIWNKENKDKRVDAREVFNKAIRESVSQHMVSDVPIGVFLSGGIDSSSLAALMVELGDVEVCGITISFRELLGTHEDEVPFAQEVAEHYGIKHYVRCVTIDEFEKDLPEIIRDMDQPSIDGINTWYASKAASELGIKVVVSGVGGDELLHGYLSFSQLPTLVKTWSKLSAIPGIMNMAKYICQFQANRSNNGRWRYAPEWLLKISSAWLLRRGLFAPDELSQLLEGKSNHGKKSEFDPVTWVEDTTGPLPPNLKDALSLIESVTYLRNQLLRLYVEVCC